MTIDKFRLFAFIAAGFVGGSLITGAFMKVQEVRAAGNHVYELRTYHTVPGRLPALQKRFRDETVRIFDKHGMVSIGYFNPQDAPASENTLIYILQHPSREEAKKNWAAFQADPEWQKVAKASEADGKIVDHLESTFMEPTDYSALK